jgi:hypothetical protein
MRRLSSFMALALLSALGACASQTSLQVSNVVEARHYAAAARPRYAPPGPPGDPWGPYVVEASARYDVPQSWIRGVMHRESDGQEFQGSGLLTISDKGAMGLMQVMPETYDELRMRYGFGDDPYDPHNNILAGAAFMRELYDKYGMPGFLAAYNAGPGRLDKYLANSATLPDETRRYVAAIAPAIEHDLPAQPSAAGDLALNRLPDVIPAGLRHPRTYMIAWRRNRRGRRVRTEVLLASTAPRAAAAPPVVQLAMGATYVRRGHGFHLIGSAMADTLPPRHGGERSWAIQVGAYGHEAQARAALVKASLVAGGAGNILTIHTTRAILYRARVTGLSREAALTACTRLHHGPCLVLSPDAQS